MKAIFSAAVLFPVIYFALGGFTTLISHLEDKHLKTNTLKHHLIISYDFEYELSFSYPEKRMDNLRFQPFRFSPASPGH